jgi:hypothetical protein
LYFWLTLNLDYDVKVNLLLLIFLIVTKSCVLYLLTHILSSQLFLVQQCEFEEYLYNGIPPNYQGPWNKIESEAKYNMRSQEHRRLLRQYFNTLQQLSEWEIGVKLFEDQLIMRLMVRGIRSRRGRGS